MWQREVLESPSIYGLGLRRKIITAKCSSLSYNIHHAQLLPISLPSSFSSCLFLGSSAVEPPHSALLSCDYYVDGGMEGRACVPPLGMASVETSLAPLCSANLHTVNVYIWKKTQTYPGTTATGKWPGFLPLGCVTLPSACSLRIAATFTKLPSESGGRLTVKLQPIHALGTRISWAVLREDGQQSKANTAQQKGRHAKMQDCS